uniref:Uncharacterized protein n=1 Tax=Arundo donax TaxID=35708 RepID=A0A0A9BJ69_ARUDO
MRQHAKRASEIANHPLRRDAERWRWKARRVVWKDRRGRGGASRRGVTARRHSAARLWTCVARWRSTTSCCSMTGIVSLDHQQGVLS